MGSATFQVPTRHLVTAYELFSTKYCVIHYALTIRTLKKKFYNWPVVTLVSHFHQVISKAVVFKEEPIHLRECLELCNGVQKENALSFY